MTETITDPQLTAFWASQPGQLTPPSIVEPPERGYHKELELAIAAAILIAVKVTRDKLAARHETMATAGAAARTEWASSIPIWLKAVLPSILRAYELGHIGDGLDRQELEAIAASYASGLGQYIGETSAQALQAGFAQQLNSGWDAHIAWQRAAAGYGLDQPATRGYLKRIVIGLTGSPDLILTPAARSFVDKAMLVRADFIGRSEAWTALETGKTLSWMYLVQLGVLPPGTEREWDTAEDEATCEICAPLDGTTAALDEPFQLPSSGRKLWAPQAHPGCRCHVRLVEPVEKAWTPDQARKHPRGNPNNAGQYRAKVKEHTPDPAVEAFLERSRNVTPPDETTAPLEFGEPLEFGGQLSFEALRFDGPLSMGSLAMPQLPLSMPVQPLGFADRHAAYRARRDAERRVIRRRTAVIRRTRDEHDNLPVLRPKPPEETYSLAVADFNIASKRQTSEAYTLGEIVNFSQAHRRVANWDTRMLRVTETDPWFAPDRDVVAGKRKMSTDPINRVALDGLWEQTIEKARPLWDEAMDRAGELLDTGRLDVDDLHEIMVTAGVIDPTASVDRDEAIQAIKTDVSDYLAGVEGTSIADAYADHVVWQKSRALGENGDEFERHMSTLYDSNIYFGIDPAEQVFTFDPMDVHQGDKSLDSVVPTDDYEVNEITYESALHDRGGPQRSMIVGLQQLHMKPVPFHPTTTPGGSTLGG